jgi:DNA-binding response OmpR family regulator
MTTQTNGRLPRERPAMADRLYTDDELEFIRAVDAYRRRTRTKFLTCRDVLKVVHSLGYRKG